MTSKPRPDLAVAGRWTAQPQPSWARRWSWLAYLGSAVTAIFVYLFSSGALHTGPMMNAIGASSVLAMVIGVSMHRPAHRLPWILIALGQAFFITGDVISYNYERFFGTAQPFPAYSDVFYLAVYPTLVVGLLLMIRARNPGRDWSVLIDSLIITIGLGVVSLAVLIAPYMHDTSLSFVGKAISMAYPLMDVLLLAFAVRLAFSGGRREPAYRLMLLAIVSLLVTDSIYSWLLLHGGYDNGGLLDGGWLLFYVLFGTAALHPSMRHVAQAVSPQTRLTPFRLVLLASAALTAPMVEIVQSVRSGQQDVVLVAAASILLFLLVIARMAGLIRVEQQARRRERALSAAGAALVTATSSHAIHEAALQATRTLAGVDCRASLFQPHLHGDGFLLVASDDATALADHEGFTLADLPAEARERLSSGRSVETRSPWLAPALTAANEPRQLLAPLLVRDQLTGVLAIAHTGIAASIRSALETLAFQVALALESAAVTEDILRSESEARFASLVQNSSDVVTVVSSDTTVGYASPSAERVLGYDAEQLAGTRLTALLDPDGAAHLLRALRSSSDDGDGRAEALELTVRRPDGSDVHVETLITNLTHDPNVAGYVLNTRDVTERKQFEEQLEHQAFHDAVTGLANRALFRDRVEHALDRRSAQDVPVAVLFLDVDDFKTVNDSLGHVAGDLLLRGVAERIAGCIRTADTAARLGGDEFAVLLEATGDDSDASEIADRVLDALTPPFTLEGKEVRVRASIGIAFADEHTQGEQGAEELLRNADVAMYTAKEHGKGTWQIFEPAMHRTVLERLELKADLQAALENGGFTLNYQPIVELETGDISGFEALLRWVHPVRGPISPLQFIPLAEDTGLILPIGRWVLNRACEDAVRLQSLSNSRSITMSVNLSGRQLQRPEIVDEVQEALRAAGLSPASLVLELTESVMMEDMELSMRRLHELKQIGVKLAVDDFGTGYSSLNYIRRFPVDILKVDKSFIDGVGGNGEQTQLTRAIIGLAEILNLHPVAEGIEEPAQLERLRELQCRFGQGYLFAKPVAIADAEDMMADPHLGERYGERPAA